ncbi:MAG: branched-chain amino acid ABC transporter permease, partial [Rhodospirillales bacterium]|nr:branched-chain amino acid ABC transporter permease [Rhodospirillales bacterium]
MRPDFFRLLRSWRFIACLLAIASMQIWLSPYYLGIANLTLFYLGLAAAWNIVGGIAGQISLGHSLFFAVGALLPAVLLTFGVNPWLGMCAGSVAAALLGMLLT